MQAEERFGHLLQPIRDLATNWNIKIADELNEYLEALEQIAFTFEGGTSLNFAEAALVIQGSACVYSKKVEYLHTLVYQALEHIAQTKDGRTSGKAGPRSQAGGEGGEDSDAEEDEKFLSLDDTLEEGAGLDLEDEDGLDKDDDDWDGGRSLRPPPALLALTAAPEKEGELAGFRVHICSVHASGALLLDRSDGEGLGEDLRPCWSHEMEHPEVPPNDNVVADNQYHYDDDDNGPDYAGDDFGDWNNPPPEAGHHGDYVVEQEGEPTLDEEGGRILRSRGQQHPPPSPENAGEDEKVWDPYTPLDPDDASCLPVKPYKRYTRVPTKPRVAKVPARPKTLWQVLASPALDPGTLTFSEFSYALSRPGGKGEIIQPPSVAPVVAQSAFDPPSWPEEIDDGGAYDDGYEADDYDAYDAADLPPTGADDAALLEAAAGEAIPFPPLGPPSDSNTTEPHPDQLSYEELCRRHVERLMAAAAAAQVQTELAGRVVNWRERIVPVLEEEDARSPFDIHEYGDAILESLEGLTLKERGTDVHKATSDSPSSVLQFGDVIDQLGDVPRYDVSRSFSALLQLINGGAVGINKVDDQDPTRFELALLQTKAHGRAKQGEAPDPIVALPLVKVEQSQGAKENQDPQQPSKQKGSSKKSAAKRRKAIAR